jgi:hypothetical protein
MLANCQYVEGAVADRVTLMAEHPGAEQLEVRAAVRSHNY